MEMASAHMTLGRLLKIDRNWKEEDECVLLYRECVMHRL